MTNSELFDLIARFEGSSLHTLRLSRGDFSLELSKGGAPASWGAPAAASPASAAAPSPTAAAISAPLVGTYYAAPAPGAPAFVRVGDHVKKGETVCLIEAMKMLSEIPAPCDCVITAVLKENGSLAAFDEPLFHYQPC